MKRCILLLAVMVGCASTLIVLVDALRPVLQQQLVSPEGAISGPEMSVEEVVDTVGPAVVAITTKEKRFIPPTIDEPLLRFFGGHRGILAEMEGIGSGVIFDPDGYVLTSDHVIGNAQEIQVVLADGRNVGATICGRDPEIDIAVIKLDEEVLPVAEFGRSNKLNVGQLVLAFGNPFGTASASTQPSVTWGVISALHRNLRVSGNRFYQDLIQTDAAINIGNNGGPLVDLSGKVIGINTLIITSSGASTSVGFAVPIDLVIGNLDKLKRQRPRRRIRGRV